MARLMKKVLLGYEDEVITDKYKDQVNYTTNKIGGKPDWPGEGPTAVTCKLCGLSVPLVVQIYAPLEGSVYHRTLYIFACINPNCWNQGGSWVCLRSQVIDPSYKSKGGEEEGMDTGGEGGGELNRSEWCHGGEDWHEDDPNGNTTLAAGGVDRLEAGLMSLSMADDEANANAAAQTEGCGTLATAVIEHGDEGDVVCIDTPTSPRVNIVAMLEEAAPLPQVGVSEVEFEACFVSVGEEGDGREEAGAWSEGAAREDWNLKLDDASKETESYEKTLPPHGDALFHALITRIHANPGQILRYGGRPLLLDALDEKGVGWCRHCGAGLVFELQILPTLIPKLRLRRSAASHLEFGCVLLYSCRASCWALQDTIREETLIVQAERM